MTIWRGKSAPFAGQVSRLAFVLALGMAVAGCADQNSPGSFRAYAPIPAETVALMNELGTDSHQPILIRAFKKEAELEIWKMRPDGQYVHLKTFPMCRWSGQLGPKRKEGDRQVPEGFYTITQGQMNPNSAYYLSFNVGYPNSFDKANGFTGGSIMVHGDCSSAGCFSMTDEQIAEIYAITREAFGGGQRAIQMQSLPFRMSPENLAKHRFDPNIRFWKQLKDGVDQFEVTKRETRVGVCDKRYVFGAAPVDANARLDANFKCPPMNEDPALKAAVSARQARDNQKIAELVASGVKAVKIYYADGGQHPTFASSVSITSRPDALAKAPVEIAINEAGKPLPAIVQVASVKAEAPKSAVTTSTSTATAPVSAAPKTGNGLASPANGAPVAQRASAEADVGKTVVGKSVVGGGSPAQAAVPAATNVSAYAPAPAPVKAKPFYKSWLGLGDSSDSVEKATAPAAAPPAAPSATATIKPQASLAPKRLPRLVAGAQPPLPSELRAYAPVTR